MSEHNSVTFNKEQHRWISHVENNEGQVCCVPFREKHRAIDNARINALRLGVKIPLRIEEIPQ